MLVGSDDMYSWILGIRNIAISLSPVSSSGICGGMYASISAGAAILDHSELKDLHVRVVDQNRF
jgi:hypothetical protein